MTLTLSQLQKEQAEWASYNFPDVVNSWEPFLGIVEEVGELSHALLKRKQGIRGTEWEHQLEIWDSVGDIVVYLADFCTREKIDFHACVEQVWERVKQRDWQKDKLNGTQEVTPAYGHFGGHPTGHAP